MEKIKDLIKRLDRYSPYPLFYKFAMSKKEQEVFNKYIKNSKYYLEFGSGGSTIRALQISKAKIYSVESSIGWINYLSEYKVLNYAKNKRVFFHAIDIGKTEGWGYPVSNKSKHLFPNYSNKVFSSLNSVKIDTVLIDGRFRVACALSVILNLYKLNSDTIILIHDFWNRKQYHILLEFLIKQDSVDTLGVFKIKKGLDLSLIQQKYDTYKFISE
ncbi:MAG: hypothetical protein V3V28_03970 [Polaribacter sp.]|uniref:hypothetical protein n=1 Tax=Polaribacter sp. TaxID=1920175 RepID=UPI002F3588C7